MRNNPVKVKVKEPAATPAGSAISAPAGSAISAPAGSADDLCHSARSTAKPCEAAQSRRDPAAPSATPSPSQTGSAGSTATDMAAFIEQVAGARAIRIEHDFGAGFVRLKTSEAELRQAAQDIKCVEDAVIELLRNSRDAGAKNIYLATCRTGNMRRIVVADDGCGIPADMQERIFDARVTSKLDTAHMDRWGMHGRGMALYSIKVNAADARVMQSAPGRGSAIAVDLDTTRTPEKTDQSSTPKFVKTDTGYTLRGPKNICRVASEFAIEHARDCNVYFGSPVDVCAAINAAAHNAFDATDLIFRAQALAKTAPVPLAPALAATPADFAASAAALGLDISDRSARRIQDKQIAPPGPLALQALTNTFKTNPSDLDGEGGGAVRDRAATPARDGGAASTPNGAATPARDGGAASTPNGDEYFARSANYSSPSFDLEYSTPKRIDFAEEDLQTFKTHIQQAFESLAYAYYLDAAPEIKIQQNKGELKIKIPLTAN